MRQSAKYEFWVGLFTLISILAIIFVSLKVAGFKSEKTYHLTAQFENIGSLKVRSAVKIGGVTVGSVSNINLDPTTYSPVVTLEINDKFNQLTESTSASIKTAGLLGEQYIALTPGFVDPDDPTFLKDGSEISNTQSALVLEDLIGKFLYNSKK